MQGLIDRIKPKFQSNFHSFGEWLLYPQGWLVGALDADYPIYVATGGTDDAVSGGIDEDDTSAIPGFNPGQSADTLYVTNGETTDYADTNGGTVAFTPELGEGTPGSGFVFPDNEQLVQEEFERTLDFDLGLAKSAADPDDPESPVGIETEPFYLDPDHIDRQHGQTSLFDFKFKVSYGDPQEVRVLAKRSLGDVTLRYRINGGPLQTKPTSEWQGGEDYGVGTGTYYHVMSGQVTGTEPGDTVSVSFQGGGERSRNFRYEVEGDTGNSVLILASEDYTGASQLNPPGASAAYLSYYRDALSANGVDSDVYDVDAHGRMAPDVLGVLSHYDAVVWYTGDNLVTRKLGWGPGNVSRLAMQELYEVRDYINQGGRALYAGQAAGQQFTSNLGLQLYDPFRDRQCSTTAVEAGCLASSGSGDSQGDPIEYTFGAAITTADGGSDPETFEPFEVEGIDDPLDGVGPFGFNGADSAQNHVTNSSFIATGDFLQVTDPAGSFPQFESWPAAEYLVASPGPSIRTRASRSCGRIDPTRRTSGCRGRSRSRRAARPCRSGRATTSSSTSTT